MEALGIEPDHAEPIGSDRPRIATSPPELPTARNDQVRDLSSPRTIRDDSIDAVEAALATALERASAAGEWGAVGQLARELEARRVATTSSNVLALDVEKARRGERR